MSILNKRRCNTLENIRLPLSIRQHHYDYQFSCLNKHVPFIENVHQFVVVYLVYTLAIYVFNIH